MSQFQRYMLRPMDDDQLYGIYLIIIPNEREFYELQVVQIVGHKVNHA